MCCELITLIPMFGCFQKAVSSNRYSSRLLVDHYSNQRSRCGMRNLILKSGAKAYRSLELQRIFSSDSLANIKFLSDGLLDRRNETNNEHDRDVINRIICSYHAAKEEQKNVPLPYQPGGAWKEDIERRRAEYLKVLDSRDFEGLRRLLRNFFRNNGVAGVWTYGYYRDIVNASNGKKKRFINGNLEDFKTLIDFVDNFDISNLEVPLVGNPWGYFIKGTLVLPTACRHYYYARHVKSLLEDIETPVVCEIGGGFGGFAYYLLSVNRCVKYVNFDLPEVLLIAQYFLMNAFPEKRVLLYGENRNRRISQEEINSYDMILMPNFALPNVTDKTADMFVNTGSFSEMDYHTIEEYIKQITRITKRYLFHDNSDRPKSNTEDHIEVVSSEFPIPLDIFKRIYKSNSLWGGGSGRYREHLYQRMKS